MSMDGAAKSFMSDLAEIRADVKPRLEEAERKADQIRAEALGRVEAACTLWASQSERPGAIRQAAKVATMKLERGESCDLSIMSARSVLAAGFTDRKETPEEIEQKRRRELIRANFISKGRKGW